jgi:hypothetical protein
MANALSSFKKEIRDRRIQMDLNKSLVALPLARFGFSEVTGATKFNRPKKTRLYSVSYTAETPMGTQALGSWNEYLEVDQTRAVHFFIDDTQKLESNYDIYAEYAPEAVYALRNEMDGKFLWQVTNAFYTVGKLDIEGTGANTSGITITTSLAAKMLSFAKAKLVQNRVETTTPFFVVLDPMDASVREQTLIGSGFTLADTTLRNGYLTSLGALGLDVYVSNNVHHTITFTSTKNVAEADAITIGSQKFTWNATISGAGSVLLGANEEKSIKNMVAAINAAGIVDTTYVDITQDERAKLKQNLVTATYIDAHSFSITTAGFVSITETVDGGTAFSFGEHQRLSPLGQKGCIDMVIQKAVQSETQRGTSNGVIGDYVTTWTRYGLKTFTEGKQRMVAIRVKAV